MNAALNLVALLFAAQQPPVSPPPEKKSDEIPLTVSLKDGIRFKSADGEFEATLGGYLGVHYRWSADRPDDPGRASPDTFYIRQARPELLGTIARDYEFRVQFDFPTGTASSVSGSLLDAYLGWRRSPEFGVRFGQFKEPFGQEQTTPDRRVELDERSVVDRLSPGRDLGILFAGAFAGGLLSYEAGVFNGQGRVVDANDEKDVVARLRSMPFAGDEFLRGLRLGVGASAGDMDDASINGLDLITPALGILFLDADTGTLDGLRTRWGVELTWIHGSFTFRTEWIRRRDEVDVGGLEDEPIVADGWTVIATWILTGESRLLEGAVTPADPFDLSRGSWGAVELAVQAARLEVDDSIFERGIAPAQGNSAGVTTFLAGLNWFPHRKLRVSPNLIVERFDDSIDFSDGRSEDRFMGGILKFQVEF